jgi:alpha-galactosidase
VPKINHLLAVLEALVLAGYLAAEPARALTNGLALQPPMGWNTWYKFLGNYDESVIRATADAMVTNGLLAAGYQYLNLDDCWFSGRDDAGNLVADPAKFPSGMPNLVSYVHGRGLKIGLYVCATNCGYCTSYVPVGYETNDALQLAGWGVDFVKIDYANQQPLAVGKWQSAFAASGRPIVLSLSGASYESWMPALGNAWRTSFDEITEDWSSIMRVLDDDNRSAAVAGPGRWNDADMLQIGILGRLSETEYRSHFALWCLIASPLLLATDVRYLTPEIKSIVTAPELIAANQDAAGVQGTRILSLPGAGGNLEVWCKLLGYDGTQKAVALFNRGTNLATISVNWTNLLLQPGPAQVRDLWACAELGTYTNSYTASVAPHGAVVVRIAGTPLFPLPQIDSVQRLGNALVLRGSHAGSNSPVTLLSGTNLAQPLPLWAAVATGTCDANGKFSFSNRLGQASQVFFRVHAP